MFYNGFTLLMQIFAGIFAYQVGNYFGYKRGEVEMYKRCRSADDTVRQFFSNVSKK